MAPLYGRLALFYGAHLVVGFYALLVLRGLVGRRQRSPGWVSLRLLAWEGTLVVVGGGRADVAELCRLSACARRGLASAGWPPAAGATTLCAVLLGAITFVHYSFGRRGSRVGATLLVLTLVASVLFPLAARGWGLARPLVSRAIGTSTSDPAERDGPQITIVAVDGASLDYVSQTVADGRLPAFGRLLEGGVVDVSRDAAADAAGADLDDGRRPGKYPPKTGIRAAATYGFAPGASRSSCCPTSVSRTRWCTSASCARFRIALVGAARAVRSGPSSAASVCPSASSAGR